MTTEGQPGSDISRWGFRWRGWFGAVLLVPAVVITMLSAPPASEASWLDLIADTFGWSLFLAGAALRLWATLYIGARKRQVVVSDGPYSVCRNPLYLGSFLIALSIGLFMESLVCTAAVLVAGAAYAFVTIPAEERVLRYRLGDEYVRYSERVPRFWPRFSQFQTPEVIEVKVKGLKLECARAVRWIWLPLLLEALAYLRVQPWWPHLFSLP